MIKDELAHMLKQLALRKKELGSILPFLEFITWSLLKGHCDQVSQKVTYTHGRITARAYQAQAQGPQSPEGPGTIALT